MKKTQSAALKDVRFHNPRLARVGVEAMDLRELRQRAGRTLGAAERLDFYLLLLVESGRATHMVDFVEHALGPGAVLLVRPGQVHQWRMTRDLQGQLLLVTAETLAPTLAQAQFDLRVLALEEWPAAGKVGETLFERALVDVVRLRADIARFAGREIETALIRHELLALLMRLAWERAVQAGAPAAPRETGIYRLFTRELETHFHERLSVLDYARRIGYSESTLARACLAAAGHTAKQALDLRVVLEAKRMLVHSDETVVQIGHRLGFSEPTNFVKFFKRLAGATPLDFRATAGPRPGA